MAYGSPPVLAGVTLPRPSSVEQAPERFGSEVTLVSGSLRSYNGGIRSVFALSWSKATEATKTALEAAAVAPVAAYVHVDGVAYTVLVDPPSSSPIPGTDPVKFEVSIALREQTPRR